ncbi:MAG TPA: hypothetical protein VGM98_09160 [Schlesneria sp.]
MLSARNVSFLVVAAGCLLPVIAFFVAHGYVRYVHWVQPTPPNQGAMVIAYLGFMATIPISVIIVTIGGVLYLRALRKSRVH